MGLLGKKKQSPLNPGRSDMESIIFKPIGTIRSPHKEPRGTPIQPPAARGIKGQVILFEEYSEGLADLDGFSHVILIYYFDRAAKFTLKVKPFLDIKEHGLFSTRAPSRPNAIGFSVLQLDSVEGNTIHVSDIDILDNTPLLDIKPFVSSFDSRTHTRDGWVKSRSDAIETASDDGRFL